MPPEVGPLGLPKLEREARERWIAEPGPGWREWFYGSFAKVYLGLAFFIVDAVAAASWLTPPAQPLGLIATLVPLVYAEYLLGQYLWHVPATPARHPRRRRASGLGEGAGSGWWRLIKPVRYGRWTEEGDRFRRGEIPPPGAGPDPAEFL